MTLGWVSTEHHDELVLLLICSGNFCLENKNHLTTRRLQTDWMNVHMSDDKGTCDQ